MGDPGTFQEDLTALGFRPMQDRGTGVVQFAAEATPYLTYWVHWNRPEATVLFTWEFAVGEFMDARDLQIGANEPLNQYLFPKLDARGPQDISFVAQEMDRADQVLRSLSLLEG